MHHRYLLLLLRLQLPAPQQLLLQCVEVPAWL
jgi:hypothetical protein